MYVRYRVLSRVVFGFHYIAHHQRLDSFNLTRLLESLSPLLHSFLSSLTGSSISSLVKERIYRRA